MIIIRYKSTNKGLLQKCQKYRSFQNYKKEYINQNDSAYFRARVGTRAILGGITGIGPAGIHGAVDNAVGNGARAAEDFIPRIIYGAD